MRCPECGSENVECGGKMHRCRDCGYDGTVPPSGLDVGGEGEHAGATT